MVNDEIIDAIVAPIGPYNGIINRFNDTFTINDISPIIIITLVFPYAIPFCTLKKYGI